MVGSDVTNAESCNGDCGKPHTIFCKR